MEKTSSDPDDDDLQGFSVEKISKCDVLDIVCAVRKFENLDEGGE
jgi:hypothetical protein